jgi:Arc/MetJ family transcription regulator
MRRTSIDLDESRLARVQRILGTTGVKDTVEGAFDEVLRGDLRSRLARRVQSGEGIERGPGLLRETRPTR